MALAFSLLEQRRQMKAQKKKNSDADLSQRRCNNELEVKHECCFLTRACARYPLSDVNVGPKIIFHTCCDK